MNNVRILGLDFFQGTVDEAVDAARKGGFVVAPSGPGLATLHEDAIYQSALTAADICLLDSGLLASLWEARHTQKLSRVSGYKFLEVFLKLPEIRNTQANLWVAPSEASAQRTRNWLKNTIGLDSPSEAWHIAPQYADKPVDEVLLGLVKIRRPQFIFIGVGGGPQEKLGAWLKSRLDYRPAILCTGAAIAFMTGEQARIPDWVDRARLGWLARCLQNPRKFVPRYWQARRLVALYQKWGDRAPEPISKIQ